MSNLTPRQIVAELDRHIVGQDAAKRAVAVALRNRWRRQQLPLALRDEVLPKNILMIGPTGVGKTEIARRLAKLAQAPFLKIEATKFTEVGYVGRDVDSIIRDLLDTAIKQTREKMRKDVRERAENTAEERLLNALVGDNATPETRQKFRKMLREGLLNDKEIELQLQDNSNPFTNLDMPGMQGAQMGVLNLGEVLGKMGGRTRPRRLSVKDAQATLIAEEADKLLDPERVQEAAIDAVENNGIVFLDEIDKICARSDYKGGGDVSREGVQRDLLPLIEGTIVTTKYGPVKTDHILFIASGAFHLAKPSDLLPELQGRLPIRVELKPLTRADFVRILQEPETNLLRQYQALLATENVSLNFAADGVEALADIAANINDTIENIGARRLHTILEKLLEQLSFDASDKSGQEITIDKAFVQKHLAELQTGQDLSRFIL